MPNRILNLIVNGDVRDAVDSLRDMDREIGKVDSSSGRLAAAWRNTVVAGTAFLGVGTGLVAAGFALTKSYSDAGSAIYDMSLRTGLGAEMLSELKYAADQSGTSIEGLETGVRRMASTAYDAANGNKAALETLDALGLSVDDLRGKSPEQIFELMLAGLAGVPDEITRAALATDVFGRSGTQLLPILDGGVDGLRDLRQEARDLGIVFSEDDAAAADEFGDNLGKLDGKLQGVKNTIARELLPYANDMVEDFQDWIDQNGDEFAQDVAEGLGAAASGAASLAAGLAEVVGWFGNETFRRGVGDLLAVGGLMKLLGVGPGMIAATALIPNDSGPFGPQETSFDAILEPLAEATGQRPFDLAKSLMDAGIIESFQPNGPESTSLRFAPGGADRLYEMYRGQLGELGIYDPLSLEGHPGAGVAWDPIVNGAPVPPELMEEYRRQQGDAAGGDGGGFNPPPPGGGAGGGSTRAPDALTAAGLAYVGRVTDRLGAYRGGLDVEAYDAAVEEYEAARAKVNRDLAELGLAMSDLDARGLENTATYRALEERMDAADEAMNRIDLLEDLNLDPWREQIDELREAIEAATDAERERREELDRQRQLSVEAIGRMGVGASGGFFHGGGGAENGQVWVSVDGSPPPEWWTGPVIDVGDFNQQGGIFNTEGFDSGLHAVGPTEGGSAAPVVQVELSSDLQFAGQGIP